MIAKVGRFWPENILWQQWIGGFGAMLIMFVTGLMSGWSSPYLAKLTAEDSPLPITSDEASWVAALMNLGRLAGAPLGAFGVQYFGSKKTLLANGVPLLFCWIFVIVANSVFWLYAARMACGISLGMAFSSFPLYLGEIADPSIRGALVSMAMFGSFMGNFAGNAMGAYVRMDLFAYISLVPNTILILVFLWIPESPHYFARLDKMEEAKKSISKYNPRADAKAEAQSLKEFVEASPAVSLTDLFREINRPRNRRAGMILLALHFFMQFSGLNSVLFYSEIVLTTARLTVIRPATMVIVIGALGVPSGLASMYLSDKCGRRILMIASSAGVGVAMIGLGIHFALLEAGYDAANFQWLPMVSMVTSQMFLCAGLIPIPTTVLSELFAPNIKSSVACVSSLTAGLFSFVATKSYQPLIDTIGAPFLFWLHALVMACSVVFSITLMPETKGKTLQEIQILLTRKSEKTNDDDDDDENDENIECSQRPRDEVVVQTLPGNPESPASKLSAIFTISSPTVYSTKL